MYKESFNGNDGTFFGNGSTTGSKHVSSTLYTQEDFSLKINEGSLTEPSFFSPVFQKPHLDIYSSNRQLDWYLFTRSSWL